MVTEQVAQISSDLIRKRDSVVLSLLSKYLGYEVDSLSLPKLKGRLSLNIDVKGYETFCINGVKLVRFHSLDSYLYSKGLSDECECKIKYEVYI